MRSARFRLAIRLGFILTGTIFSVQATHAEVQTNLCNAVSGLCAKSHLASVAVLKTTVGPEGAAKISSAEEAIRSNPALKAVPDPSLKAAMGAKATLRDSQVTRTPGSLPGALNKDNPTTTPPDTARFGRPSTGDPFQAGLEAVQNRVGSNNNRYGDGAAGKARGSIASPSFPGRNSLVAGDGKDDSRVVVDHSGPNDQGGVTRFQQRADGTVIITQTGTRGDDSYVQTDTHGPNGQHDRELIYRGGDGQYIEVTKSHRDSSTDFYTHDVFVSGNGGSSWSHQRDVRVQENPVVYPRPRLSNNVDPDAPGAGSTPPVCVFSNPDCNIPLLVRFHNNRPDRRGRPSDTDNPAEVAPRLRQNTYGTVVNPVPDEGVAGNGGQTPPTARQQDGGRLVNPGRDPK
jgi:hypothetical protein